MWADFVCFGARQSPNPRRRHPPEQTGSATRTVGHLTPPEPPSPVPNLSRIRSTSSLILNPHPGASETKSAHFVSAPMWADFVCFGAPQPPNSRRRYPPEQTSSATRNVGHLTPSEPPLRCRTCPGSASPLLSSATLTAAHPRQSPPTLSPHPCGRTLSASARPNRPTHATGTRRSRQVRQPEMSAIPHSLSRPLRCRTCPGCASPLPSFAALTAAHPRQSPPTLSPHPCGRTLSASARPNRPTHAAGTRRSRQVRQPEMSAI